MDENNTPDEQKRSEFLAEKLQICFFLHEENGWDQYRLLEMVVCNTDLRAPLGKRARELLKFVHGQATYDEFQEGHESDTILKKQCAKLNALYYEEAHWEFYSRKNDEKLGVFLDNMIDNNNLDVDSAAFEVGLDIDNRPF